MKAQVIQARKDGKFKVSFSFSGGPNGFGGLNFGRTINKIMTPEQIKESIANNPEAYNQPTINRFSK